ncbi:hypothetical protein AHT88_03305 [Salmonella enterica subsp. enterica serovar Muenchen]|nr:hypothetical protein [Salmonella enterica subsp. enterica serovar Muenchen]
MKQLILILSLVSFGVNADDSLIGFKALSRATAYVIDTMCMAGIDTTLTRSECYVLYGQMVAERMDIEYDKLLAEEEEANK